MSSQQITLGAGCFWCVEAIYKKLNGVVEVQSGYSGGHQENPTYKEVCAETTGHAEVCQLIYDDTVISIEEILAVFFQIHDPTTLNRQGNDVGTQYRSVIFYHSEEQKQIAEEFIKQLTDIGKYANKIVTQVEPFEKFYQAEDYHNDYFDLHGEQPYCQFVVKPKVEKFEKLFADKLKS